MNLIGLDPDWIVAASFVIAVTGAMAVGIRALGANARILELPPPDDPALATVETFERAARQIEAYELPGSKVSTDLRLAATGLFDADIVREFVKAGKGQAEMWAEFRRRFGDPAGEMSEEQRSLTQPALVAATVRRYRALDEQLRRRGLPPAPKPPDWDLYYAGGRVGLPPPDWREAGLEQPAGIEAQRRAPIPPARVAATPPGVSASGGDPLAPLIGAIRDRCVGDWRLAIRDVVEIPKTAGTHRNYLIADWPEGRPYVHLFRDQTVCAAGVRHRVDLMIGHGVRGCVFAYLAILIEPLSGAARKRAKALRAAGYRVLLIPAVRLRGGAPEASRRVAEAAAALMTGV